MYDGSKPLYPLLKNMKIQKHQIRKTEEGKSRKVYIGGRLFFIAGMDNASNLTSWKKTAHFTTYNTKEESSHVLPIIISSFTKQSDCVFHSSKYSM